MKKCYSILWIDDEPDSIRTSKKEITSHLRKVGVIANITYSDPTDWQDGYESVPEITQCINDPELDMVLMDYNLGHEFGSGIIAQLRKADIFVPVIYYSQQDYEHLLNSLKEQDVDGVFVSRREFLEEKVKKILDSLLKREHKVRRMRGLLLSDSSEIESQGANIAEKCWTFLTDDQKKNVRTAFSRHVKKSVRSNTSKVNKFSFTFDNITEIWENRIFDASKKGCLLRKIFEELGWSEHVDIIKDLCANNDRELHIFSERNKFAHQTEQKLNESLQNIDFSKEIREKLHKAEEDMEKILLDINKKEKEKEIKNNDSLS